jgi:hypothetical protein
LAAELEDEAYAVYRQFPSGPVTPYRLLTFWLRECRSDVKLMAVTGRLTGALGLAVPLVVGRLLNFVIPAAQRIEIPILGTSALDNRTQTIVSHQIESLRVTRLVIAHRLSTIRNADRILVLHDGVIAESGACRDLMERRGWFYQMAMGCLVWDVERDFAGSAGWEHSCTGGRTPPRRQHA